MSTETLELSLPGEQRIAAQPALSPLSILDKAISGGVTKENIEVVKELMNMAREQRAEDAKAAFAKALFQLRKNMPEIYVDKEAKNSKGEVAYRYASEEEITKKLDPHLMAYGFTTLIGQSQADGKITVRVTLMHEAGHSEDREFTVRAGATNAMKDSTAADTGAATTAWRHLVMKMFGLKSRLSNDNDLRVEGERISDEQAQVLREQVGEICPAEEAKFLSWLGVKSYEEIGSNRYDEAFNALQRKRRAG